MTQTFTVGQKVSVAKMANDSFYQKVQGVVTYVRNGMVGIDTILVMSKWDKSFKTHKCSTSAPIASVVAL